MKLFTKKYEPERICVELERFIKLEPKIDTLNQACHRLMQASELLNSWSSSWTIDQWWLGLNHRWCSDQANTDRVEVDIAQDHAWGRSLEYVWSELEPIYMVGRDHTKQKNKSLLNSYIETMIWCKGMAIWSNVILIMNSLDFRDFENKSRA